MNLFASCLDESDPESRTHYPFRRHGQWLEETYWEENLRTCVDRADAASALAALRAVFSPQWSRGQIGKLPHHPFVDDAITIGGRYRLLQLGQMLRTYLTKTTRTRLLSPEDYRGAATELLTGLVLRTAGASLEREPKGEGDGDGGPDWLARWPTGELAVEVKAPQQSRRASDRMGTQHAFFIRLMDGLYVPPLAVSRHTWFTFHPTEEVVSVVNAHGSRDAHALDALADDTARLVRERMPTPMVSGRFSAGRAGDFELETRDDLPPQLNFSITLPIVDWDHAELRIRDNLQKAASQLRKVPHPGLVVFDTHAAMRMTRQPHAILEMLCEPWASDLAGVAFVDRPSSADYERGEQRIDTTLTFLPGRCWASLEPLVAGLRRCDAGHFHSDSLVPAKKSCLTRLGA